MSRNIKYWKKRLGKIEYDSPYQDHLDFRGLWELNDDGLEYYLTGVKGINMLDLNETEITNKSIALLSTLEYVNELRIKECAEIDDDCIADLNKITSLQFLHIKDTEITWKGILHLDALYNLKTLLFSADNADLEEKMAQLKGIMPNCDFVVNSVPYIF